MTEVSNVAAFPGHITYEPEIVQSAIDALEDMLAQAKRGELIGLSCVYVMHTGRAAYWVAGKPGGYSTIGAVECMKRHLIECVDDDS